MDNHRLVLHERAIPLLITPDALRLRVGRCSSKYTAEHLEGRVDPVLLVDRCRTIALDARNEQLVIGRSCPLLVEVFHGR